MDTNIPSASLIVQNASFAVFRVLDKKRTLKQPIARFDVKTKRIYLENGDGTTEYVGAAMTQRRHSERHKKPEIVVFADPNGSGKSTITELLRPADMKYINADDIQRVLGREPIDRHDCRAAAGNMPCRSSELLF